jgi:hypothetical protein
LFLIKISTGKADPKTLYRFYRALLKYFETGNELFATLALLDITEKHINQKTE